MVDARATIIAGLMSSSEPTNLATIARTCKLSIQHADYWLQKLIEEGVVLCDQPAEQRLYLLQPLFYDPSFATHFDKVLNSLYILTKKKLQLPPEKKEDDVAFNVLLSILHVIAREKR